MRNVKKVLAVFLAALFVLPGLGALYMPACAQDGVEIIIVPDKTVAAPGETVTYTVSIGPVSYLKTGSIILQVPEGLTFVPFSESELNELNGKLANVFTNAGPVYYENSTRSVVFNSQGYSSSEPTELMQFRCTVADNASGELTVGIDEGLAFTFNKYYDLAFPTYDPSKSAVTIRVPEVSFYVPEAVYLKTGDKGTQWYLNSCGDDGQTPPAPKDTTGKLYFHCDGATSVQITLFGGRMTGMNFFGTDTIADNDLQIVSDNGDTIRYSAKYVVGGITRTAHAYTYLYEPYRVPTGCATEAESDEHNNGKYDYHGIVTALWGAQNSGIKENTSLKDGADVADESIYLGNKGLVTAANSRPRNSGMVKKGDGTFGAQNNDNKNLSITSPTAYFCVDTSRFTNLNQIPNMYVGLTQTDDQHTDYCTLETYLADGHTSGQTMPVNISTIIPETQTETETVIRQEGACTIDYDVSDLQPAELKNFTVFTYGESYCDSDSGYYTKSYQHTHFQIVNTDKSALRELYLSEIRKNYVRQESYYTSGWDYYNDYMRTAAEVLGNPYVTIMEVQSATSELRQVIDGLEAIPPAVTRTAIERDGTDGYRVYAQVETNGGAPIDRVQFPTWTDKNGQDDIQKNWENNSAASGTFGAWSVDGQQYNYMYYVDVSDHNNEYAGYNTHVYAYNVAGASAHAEADKVNFNYTVRFEGCGATGGSVAAQTVIYGESVTLPSVEREGYMFLGWAETANADAPQYQSGKTFKPSKDTTLYAVWGVAAPSVARDSKAIVLAEDGKAPNLFGAQESNVWFGNYMQSSADSKEPVKWRVLENKDGKLFLLADQNLDVVRYNEERIGVTWADCTLRKWLNGYENHPYDDTFIGNAFSEKELTAVADSEVENANNPEYNANGGSDTTDKVFLLSIAEATNTGYGFTADYDDTDTRKATNTQYAANGGHTGVGFDNWWLRSPGRVGSHAAIVFYGGLLFCNGYIVSDPDAVRPAFKMNLNSVLFTSAAVGGKSSGAVGADAILEISAYSGNDWKLTLLDETRSDFTASCTKDENGLRTITYSGATTGTNEKISAMIVSADGAVTYYGVLCDAAAGKNTLTLDVNGKLQSGDTLYVFNEQVNGDKKTDYASALVDVTAVAEKIETAVTIDPIDPVFFSYDAEIKLSVTPADAEGDLVVYVDGETFETTTDELTLTIPTLANVDDLDDPQNIHAGSYVVRAEFKENDEYKGSETAQLLTVAKNKVDIEICCERVYIENEIDEFDLTFYTTVCGDRLSNVAHHDLLTGECIVQVDEVETYYRLDSDWGRYHVFSGLPIGEHCVIVRYPGDRDHEAAVSSETFKMNPVVGWNGISVAVPDTGVEEHAQATVLIFDEFHLDTAALTVKNSAGETVREIAAPVSDYTGSDPSVQAVATADLGALDAGRYTLETRVDRQEEGSNGGLAYTATTAFRVLHKDTAITITAPQDLTAGKDADFGLALTPAGATGEISVFADGTRYTAAADSSSVTIPALSAGTHEIRAYYAGDDGFVPAESQVTVTVSKAEPTLQLDHQTSYSESAEPVIGVTLTNAADPTGDVTVMIDNEPYTGTIVDGNACVTIPAKAAGKYVISAYYKGDQNNEAAFASGEYTVTASRGTSRSRALAKRNGAANAKAETPAAPVFRIKPIESVTYGEDVTIELELLSEDVTGKIVVTMGGRTYETDTDHLTLTVPTEVDLEAKDTLKPGMKDYFDHFYMPGIPDIDPITTESYGKKTHAFWVPYDPYTSNDNLNAGAYLVTAAYEGDETYAPAKAYEVLTVNKKKAELDVEIARIGGGVDIGITILTPSTDNAINTLINGKAYPVNEEKHVFVESFLPGQYMLTVHYIASRNDDETILFVPFENTAPGLRVDAPDVRSGDRAAITVSVSDADLVDFDADRLKTVDLDVKDGSGETVYSKTGLTPVLDENTGWWTVTDEAGPLEMGTYTVEATLSIESEFNQYKATTTLRVLKKEAALTITAPDGVTAGEDTPITVKRTPAQATGDVTVYVDGAPYTPDADGKVTVSGIAAGSHVVRAVYAGDDAYEAAEATGTFTVDKVPTSISVTAENASVIVGKTQKISFSVSPAVTTDDLTVMINNVKYDVPIQNGKGEIESPALPVGKCVVAAFLPEDDANAASFDVLSFDVNKEDPQMTVSAEATTCDKETVITATLPTDATGTVSFTLQGNVDENKYTFSADVNDGKAEISEILAADDYTITASYFGDDKYSLDNATTTIGVVRAPTGITVSTDKQTYTVGDNAAVTVTVTDAAGQAATNSSVTLKLNGAEIATIDVENGTGTYTIPSLEKGEYTLNATFNGDSHYASSETTVTFSVESDPDQDAADAVMEKIGAIGEVEYTDESKQKIDDAREAYDDLTDAQKDLVTNYDTLTDAETKYTLLEARAWCAQNGHKYVYESNNNGTHNVSCEVCDYTQANVGCDYDETMHPASCTGGAYSTFTCPKCGYSYDGPQQGDPEHTFGDEGEARYTCTQCGEVDEARKTQALADDMAEFEAYKQAQKKAADEKAQDGDSAECAQLIKDAKDWIDDVPFDNTKSLDENKQAVDTAANLAGLEKALTDQRAADAVEDKINAIGDVELTKECKDKIDAAREAYDALTDAQKDLVDNLDTLTDAEEKYEQLDNHAQFNEYKEEQKQAAEDKRKDGDSEESSALIDDAVAAINDVTYDETKSLVDNKKAIDAAANLAQLDADLAEHRAIHYAAFYADGTLVENVPYTIDTKSITEPAVPEKVGHTGTWPSYTLKAGGTRIDAVYETIPYEATFYADGVLVDTVTYNVETTSIADKEPAVPEKPGHTGEWPDYTLKVGGTRIDAVYEVIMQTVDFDPNGGFGEMESVTTAWGSTITLPECTFTAPNGKEFDKWDAGNPGDEVEVKSDLTVKAVWKEKPLTLTADVDPAQTGERIKITVPYAKRGGIAATLTASEEGVRYESSKPGVISVDENGVIRLEKLCLFCKTATITAYSADGQKVASCVVNVRHAWWQYIIWFFFGSFWF